MKNVYPLTGLLLLTGRAAIGIRSQVHRLELLQYFEHCIFRLFILDPKEGDTSMLPHFLHSLHQLEGTSHILETVLNATAQGRHRGTTIWTTHSRFQNCVTFLLFQDAIFEQTRNTDPLSRLLRPGNDAFKHVDPTYFIFVSNQRAPLVPNYEMAHLDWTSTLFFFSPQGLYLFCAIAHENPLWPLRIWDAQYVDTLWMERYSKLGRMKIFLASHRKWDYSEDCSGFYSS